LGSRFADRANNVGRYSEFDLFDFLHWEVIPVGRHAARFFIEADRVARKTAANGNDSDLAARVDSHIRMNFQ
jgi:hypothetical protein